MTELKPQESTTSLLSDELSSEFLDLNELSITARSCSLTPDSWESDVDMLFNRMVFKIRAKIDDLKKKEESIVALRRIVEDDYKKQLADYENKITELESRKSEMEAEYAKKLKDFDQEKSKMEKVYEIQKGKIKLDVGGHLFSTSLDTLNRDPDSMIAVMFSGRHNLFKSDDGSYFIDRDGTYFRYVLNYLRGGISLPSELTDDTNTLRDLLREADYYQLKGLKELVKEAIAQNSEKDNFTQEKINEMISKAPSNFGEEFTIDFFDSPGSRLSTENGIPHVIQNMTKAELDFTNKTLNSISFAHTTFFHKVSFRSANLIGASFYGCEFIVGVTIDFSYANLTDCDFRQCKGIGDASKMVKFSHGAGLLSGASSDIFFEMVKDRKIEFRKSKLKGALFDPKVYEYLVTENIC